MFLPSQGACWPILWRSFSELCPVHLWEIEEKWIADWLGKLLFSFQDAAEWDRAGSLFQDENQTAPESKILQDPWTYLTGNAEVCDSYEVPACQNW